MKIIKKKIENLVVLVIILIITVIVINLIWNGDNGEEKKPTSDPNKKLATTIEEGITEETVQASSSSLYKIDAELEEILSKNRRSRRSKCYDNIFTN